MAKWTKVIDGEMTRWLPAESCRNSEGIPCSPYIVWDPSTSFPGPAWLCPPEGSRLHRGDLGLPGRSGGECRSMAASLDQVLEHYERRAREAGVHVRSGAGLYPGMAGFHAEDEEFRVSLNALTHGAITFWTLQYSAKTVKPPQAPRSPHLVRLVSIAHGVATLMEELTGEIYSAPADALVETEPVYPPPPPQENRDILWAHLPEWVQFAVRPAKNQPQGAARIREGAWQAVRDGSFRGKPNTMFRLCLASLDARGFDAGGERAPARSYYVLLLQGRRFAQSSCLLRRWGSHLPHRPQYAGIPHVHLSLLRPSAGCSRSAPSLIAPRCASAPLAQYLFPPSLAARRQSGSLLPANLSSNSKVVG